MSQPPDEVTLYCMKGPNGEFIGDEWKMTELDALNYAADYTLNQLDDWSLVRAVRTAHRLDKTGTTIEAAISVGYSFVSCQFQRLPDYEP